MYVIPMKYVSISPYKPVCINASLTDVIKFHEDTISFISFLSLLIPLVLKQRFNIHFSKSKFNIITKEEFQSLRTAFINVLKNIKCTNIKMLVPVLSYSKILDTPNLTDTLQEFFKLNKEKIKKGFKKEPLTEINRIINMFKTKEIKNSTKNHITTLSRYLPNTKIKNLLKSIEGFSDDTVFDNFEDAKRTFIKFLKKNFNQETILTPDQARKVRDKNPDLYKEYNKLHGNRKKLAKQVLENVWNEEEYELLDVKEAKKLLKELDIPNPIDKGFVGKVGLSTSPTGLFDYYTIYGKKLNTVPGVNVVMNPNYTKDDLCNYCTCEPQGVSTRKARNSKPVYIYTEDYARRSLERKHNTVKTLDFKKLLELRRKYLNDIQPIIQGSFTNKNIAALVTAVIDITCGRIGNLSESLENGVYGISSLKLKHLSFGKVSLKDGIKKSVGLQYVGKDSVNQKHIITNPTIIKAIKVLTINKKSNDFIFSKHGNDPITETMVNKYIKDIGFPKGFTAHTFRKYHANRIFNKYTQGIDGDPIKVFDNAVNNVAKKLGHLPSNSIKSYIDTDLINDYFNSHDVEVPKKVRNVLEKMNRLKTTNEE